MSISAITDDFLYELRKNVSKNRPLMASEIEELEQMLDETVHDFVGFVPKVREWELWLVNVLQRLEVEAAM